MPHSQAKKAHTTFRYWEMSFNIIPRVSYLIREIFHNFKEPSGIPAMKRRDNISFNIGTTSTAATKSNISSTFGCVVSQSIFTSCDVPVGRVKIQTVSKNSHRYHATKSLIRDLTTSTPNAHAGELREYLFKGNA